MSECEFERTTDDGALWFCRLPDGHPGDHACTNACDYQRAACNNCPTTRKDQP